LNGNVRNEIVVQDPVNNDGKEEGRGNITYKQYRVLDDLKRKSAKLASNIGTWLQNRPKKLFHLSPNK